jgi:hypothetical protein
LEHPLGLAFEYVYAALPKLKLLETKAPNTKITVVDITEPLTKSVSDDKYMERGVSSSITVTNYHNIRMMYQTDDVERSIDGQRKQRVAVVYAADKPHLELCNKNLAFTFSDSGCSSSGIDYREKSNHSRINFFWSRDLPLIPIKQSHMVKRLLESSSKVYKLADGISMFTANLMNSNLIKKLIYPTWDIRTYQKASKTGDQDLLDILGTNAVYASRERDLFAFNQLKTVKDLINTRHNIRWTVRSRQYNIGTVLNNE